MDSGPLCGATSQKPGRTTLSISIATQLSKQPIAFLQQTSNTCKQRRHEGSATQTTHHRRRFFGDLLCLPSASSTSASGGAPALPSPDLTADEIDTLAGVEEVAAVELAELITRCTSIQFGSNCNVHPLHVQHQHHDEEVAPAGASWKTSAIEFFRLSFYVGYAFPSGV